MADTVTWLLPTWLLRGYMAVAGSTWHVLWTVDMNIQMTVAGPTWLLRGSTWLNGCYGDLHGCCGVYMAVTGSTPRSFSWKLDDLREGVTVSLRRLRDGVYQHDGIQAHSINYMWFVLWTKAFRLVFNQTVIIKDYKTIKRYYSVTALIRPRMLIAGRHYKSNRQQNKLWNYGAI